ncbi:hypothetical protein KVT40_005967 [Elsinoe batatas]|uniref:Uncharacterized protein n=1 Tax=Elsinoe batatas TaxID=2601811 RepID=A0A8K0L0U5_9PEZI|nr:hypothetical protein KVT40_005967 [Elsinoe batatas]
MNPVVSWTVVLGVVGGAAYYYTATGKKPEKARGRSGTASEGSQPQPKSNKKEPKVKRKPDRAIASESEAPLVSAREQGESSAAEGAKKRKAGKGKAQAQAAPQVAVQIDEPAQDDGAEADKAWAQRMANARNGTNLSVPSKDSSRTKTVKTSSLENSQNFSAASSTGAEADDDESPSDSPRQAGNVSDMLEPKAAGPSVIRLTQDENRAPQRAPRQQKEFQAAETKKQRQNKKKNEERKALIEEQERDRQGKLEAQRRTAREARGEPAKNGLQQAKAPASSVWTSSQKNEGATPVQPIEDTVDRAQAPAVGNAQASVVPTRPVNGGPNGASSTNGFSNGMSEQDAIHAATKASEDESGWATVNTKKAKKGHNRTNSDAPLDVKLVESAPAPPKQVKQPAGPKVTNGFASLDTGISAGSHPDDSEWGA